MSWKLAGVTALGLLVAVAISRVVQDSETGSGTWDASRAAGFAGYLLLWASVVTGVALPLRVRPGPVAATTVLELHRVLSALALSFVAVHTIALFLDPVVHFAVVDGLVPFTSGYRRIQVGVGTVAQWLLVAV